MRYTGLVLVLVSCSGSVQDPGAPVVPAVESAECPAVCPAGEQGVQGAPGADGLDGRDGIDGVDGQDGQPGAQGPQGLKGDKGDRGDQGVQGLQGLQGAQGLQGPQGNDGVDGEDAVVSTPGTRLTPGTNEWRGSDGSTFRDPGVRFYDEAMGFWCRPMVNVDGARYCAPDRWLRGQGSRFRGSGCTGPFTALWFDHQGGEYGTLGLLDQGFGIVDIQAVGPVNAYMVQGAGCVRDTAHQYYDAVGPGASQLVEFTAQ